MTTTQTAVDLIATQCGGPDTINVYREGLTRHYHLFNLEHQRNAFFECLKQYDNIL
jgi:hypothetical protein